MVMQKGKKNWHILNLRFGPFLPGQRRFGLWRSTPGLLVATPSGASTLAGKTSKEIWKKSCFFFSCLFDRKWNKFHFWSQKLYYVGFCCSCFSIENKFDAKDTNSLEISRPAFFNSSAVSSLMSSKFWKKRTNMKLHPNFDILQQWCQWEKHFFLLVLTSSPISINLTARGRVAPRSSFVASGRNSFILFKAKIRCRKLDASAGSPGGNVGMPGAMLHVWKNTHLKLLFVLFILEKNFHTNILLTLQLMMYIQSGSSGYLWNQK